MGGVNGHSGFVTFSDVRDAQVALNVKCPGRDWGVGVGRCHFHEVFKWLFNGVFEGFKGVEWSCMHGFSLLSSFGSPG